MPDANQVVVGATGRVLVAPVGTTLPISSTAALNSAFREVGFTTEDGVTFNDSTDVEDVDAWQSFYPIRKIIAGKDSGIEFVMRQWNSRNLKLAFGGGLVESTAGQSIFMPAEPGTVDYRSLVVEWTDGSRHFRLVVPRGMVSGEVSSNVARTSAADLPISFSATPAGSPVTNDETTFPWYLITDDVVAFVTT